jgi:anti-repressor protein
LVKTGGRPKSEYFLTLDMAKELAMVERSEIETHEGQPMIDARGLHGWLGNKTPFHKWMERRVEEYGFTEQDDYWTILSVSSGGGAGRRKTDYFLTIDMAKELAMVERSEIGRETRRYFIQMEKAARDMAGTLTGIFLVSYSGIFESAGGVN